jgi:hypothetical protein
MPDRAVCSGSSGRGRTTMPELDQPLMVVVLEMLARTTVFAAATNNIFMRKGQAANMTVL